jgi:SAM-dependent methyltransferase
MQPPSAMETRSRAFYDRIADGYDQTLDTPPMRAIRACFWRRAEAELPPRARVLDFGAGSGIDAEHFAGLGHDVTAYDTSPGMLAMLGRRCAAQVAAGTVVPVAGALDEARDRLAARAPFDGVLCNFAVLSMVPRLDPVFRLFGELVRPGGKVLISIQNPWYPGDLRTRGFWKALLAFPASGALRFPSADTGFTTHHTPSQVRRAARPEFRGLPDRGPARACARRSFGPRSPFRLVALERA